MKNYDNAFSTAKSNMPMNTRQSSGISNLLKKDYLTFISIIHYFFKNKNFLKHFGFIYGLYFIGIFGLLIADILYKDDYFRHTTTMIGHINANRHLSWFLSNILHTSWGKITDISPLIAHGGYVYYRSRFGITHPLVSEYGDALRLCTAACHKYGMKCHPRRSCWSLGMRAPKETLERFRSACRLHLSHQV